MVEHAKAATEPKDLTLKLYSSWVREGQKRPVPRDSDDKGELEEIRADNFVSQLVKPRRSHLEQLKEVAEGMSTGDKVALLVMMELPALEISTLLHRLSLQLAENPGATYFSKENQLANCGCGCG
jgi:hypothetical protein